MKRYVVLTIHDEDGEDVKSQEKIEHEDPKRADELFDVLKRVTRDFINYDSSPGKYQLEELSIKDQAYYIMVGLEGSWLYNALHKQAEDETWCVEFVAQWKEDGGEVDRDRVEHYINENYEGGGVSDPERHH